MTRSSPTIAVLLPVYNAGAFLNSAILSIRNQTFADFELVIVDDGSTDGSGEIIEHHAKQDGRVTFIQRENRGLVSTLNEMLNSVDTPLIARMDADDIAFAQRFEWQADRFANNPRLVCLGGGVELIRDDGEPLLSPDPILGNDHIQAAALSGRTPLSHPAVMMRTAAVKSVGGYHTDAYPAEDLDLFLRLGELGELDNLPQRILQYRMHHGSISATRSEEQLSKMRRACEAAWTRRGITGQFDAELEAKPNAGCPIGANPTASALARSLGAE